MGIKIESAQEFRESFAVIGKDAHIDVDTFEWTLESFAEKYAGATSYMLFNPLFGNVLHLLTDLDKEEGLLWETFANVDGEQRHWLHFLYEKWPNPRLWSQAYVSQDKPDEVIGRQWYAYRIDNMSPFLLILDEDYRLI